jgi:hypothetical protein
MLEDGRIGGKNFALAVYQLLEGTEFASRWDQQVSLLQKRSNRLWSPPSFPFQWVSGFFPGGKAAEARPTHTNFLLRDH